MPRAPRTTPPAHVALLRGVNVGGKNRLPMQELAALFEAAGCTGVRTYIQSGNVAFRADARTAKTLAGTNEAAIAQRFGFTAPVVLRSGDALAAALHRNPFLAEGVDPSRCTSPSSQTCPPRRA